MKSIFKFSAEEAVILSMTALWLGGCGGSGGDTPSSPPPPVGTVNFATVTYTVNETTSAVQFSVTRTGGSSGAVSVDVSTVDGSATAGTDYTSAALSISFGDGETAPISGSVEILDDPNTESDETFELVLGNPTGGVSIGPSSRSIVTIVDDDAVGAPGAPALQLTMQQIKILRFTWSDVQGEDEYRLLENADGSSGFTEVATIAADSESYDHEVLLPARLNARYILDACNGTGCVDSNEVFVGSDVSVAVGSITAGIEDDFFGHAVALSNDGLTLAVGASDATNAVGVSAVYVYTRDAPGTWSQEASIERPISGTAFGSSLAFSNDGARLAVGAPNENSTRGAVYVYARDAGGTWSQDALLTASNADIGDLFGWSVALVGGGADAYHLAVGAPEEDGAADFANCQTSPNPSLECDSGAVYTFTSDGGGWSEDGTWKSPTPGWQDHHGWSVALTADALTLAIGVPGEDDNRGAVHVISGGARSILNLSAGVDDNFGWSVALSGLSADGSTLAVGAPVAPDAVARGSGAVYVFAWDGGRYSQVAQLVGSSAGAGASLGISVALSGDGSMLAAGAQGEAGFDTGAAYVFTRGGSGAWSELAHLTAPSPRAGAQFGRSVALSRNALTLAVGEPAVSAATEHGGGSVYIY